MAGMTVDGLVSGLDTTSLISQLMQVEAQPQTLLKSKLSATQSSATAYRAINTKFDALRSAAEALGTPEAWASAKATSSAASVTVALSSTPPTGSLTFKVTGVAASHSVVSASTWSATASTGFSSLDVYAADGTTKKGTITVGGTGTATDVATAINASSFGLSASAVQVAPGTYALQVTAKTSGAAAKFVLGSGTGFKVTNEAADARLAVGTTANAYEVTSPTNEFAGLLPGATIKVTQTEATPVTVGIVADPDAVAAKVQSLVDAANSALAEIKKYSSSTGGTTAVLKGDSGLSRLASTVLQAVSDAVGADGSAGAAGLQLKRDGTVAFDKTTFLGKLASAPDVVRRLFAGTPAAGADGKTGTTDDGVPGVALRLQTVAKDATNTTTGTLGLLAKGRDDLAKDIQKRIDNWDLRLAQRKDTLTRQFTAMETALSALHSKATWLSGQLSSL